MFSCWVYPCSWSLGKSIFSTANHFTKLVKTSPLWHLMYQENIYQKWI
jgi:hypothetical protein